MVTETLSSVSIKRTVTDNGNLSSPSPLDIELRCKLIWEDDHYKKFWDPEREHCVWVKIYHGGDYPSP